MVHLIKKVVDETGRSLCAPEVRPIERDENAIFSEHRGEASPLPWFSRGGL